MKRIRTTMFTLFEMPSFEMIDNNDIYTDRDDSESVMIGNQGFNGWT